MKMLPPPLPVEVLLVASAAKRGLRQSVIARAIGLSRNAVFQRIGRFEKYYGPLPQPNSRRSNDGEPKISIKCRWCGNIFWQPVASHNENYCSRQCSGKAKRSISEEDIKWLIGRRGEGQSWKGLAAIFGRDVQTIQNNIWIYLVDKGELTEQKLKSVWEPQATRHYSSWLWLIERNGQTPDS